jgi:hypothetical protein
VKRKMIGRGRGQQRKALDDYEKLSSKSKGSKDERHQSLRNRAVETKKGLTWES